MVERKVVFPTSFEGAVERGLELATRFAAEHSATLVVLHVVPLSTSEGEGMLYQGLDLAHGRPAERLQALVPTDPSVPYLHLLAVGDPEERIVEYVARESVDLVVLESRRRGFFGRLWGAGLATRVRERVRCPVLTFRGDDRFDPSWSAAVRVTTDQAPFEALEVILGARVDALSRWLSERRRAARDLGNALSIRDGAAALVRGSGVFGHRVRQLLAMELEEHRKALGASGFALHHGGVPLLERGESARDSLPLASFVERLARDGAAVSLPLEASGASADHVILAAAEVPVPGAEPASLVLTFDARRDFLRILAQPGPTPSTETYAFDAEGLMLSNSRFPDQLRSVGLLPAEPGVQTPRRMRVCDPGGNLLEGEVALRPALPLTRMASAAVAGNDGADWHGYRDYRGVEVVGTWRWIREYGFGVAAEMDRPR